MRFDPSIFDKSIELVQALFNKREDNNPISSPLVKQVIDFFSNIYPGAKSNSYRFRYRDKLVKMIANFNEFKLGPLLGASNPANSILSITKDQLHLFFIERNNKEAQQFNFNWDSFSEEPNYMLRCLIAYYFMLVLLYICYKDKKQEDAVVFFESHGFTLIYIINALCSRGKHDHQQGVSYQGQRPATCRHRFAGAYQPVHSNGIFYTSYAEIGMPYSDALMSAVISFQGHLVKHFTRSHFGKFYQIKAMKLANMLHVARTPPPLEDSINYLSAAFSQFALDISKNDNAQNKYETIIRFISFLDFVHPFRDGNARTHDFSLQIFLCVFYKLEPILIFDPAFLSFGNFQIQQQILQEGRAAYKAYMCAGQPVDGRYLLRTTTAATSSYDNDGENYTQPCPRGVRSTSPVSFQPPSRPAHTLLPRNIFQRAPLRPIIGARPPAIVRQSIDEKQ